MYWHLLSLSSIFLSRRCAGYFCRILFIRLYRNRALSLAGAHWSCRTKSIPRINICQWLWLLHALDLVQIRICVFTLPFWKISYFTFLSSKTVVKYSNSFSLQAINILELEKYNIPLFNNKLSKPPVVLKAEFWCHFLKKKNQKPVCFKFHNWYYKKWHHNMRAPQLLHEEITIHWLAASQWQYLLRRKKII